MSAAVIASRTDAAWRVLAGVLDPEVPVLSVLDLGIVRGVNELEDGTLEVVLTPTYSGCPAVEVIEADIVAALNAASLGPVRVRTQRAPAWTTNWISKEGQRKLREYGIAPPGHVADIATIYFRPRPVRAEPVEALQRKPADPSTSSGRTDAWVQRARLSVACPRCASTQTERLSAFGATACKALYRCLACREPFEHMKPL